MTYPRYEMSKGLLGGAKGRGHVSNTVKTIEVLLAFWRKGDERVLDVYIVMENSRKSGGGGAIAAAVVCSVVRKWTKRNS